MADVGGFLDLNKFEFCGETLQAMSELIMDETIKGQSLDALHTIYPNILTKKEIGFVGRGGLVGVLDGGCDSDPDSYKIATRKVKWDPIVWEIFLKECYTELEDAASVYSLGTGVDIPDFTETDYMNVVMEVLRNSVNYFWYRMFWFGDVDATTVSEGGVLTDGTPTKYFTLLDGFWKQVMAQITANASQYAVEIAENAGETYEAQALDVSKVQGYLSKLISAAPLQLRNLSDKFILCTQSVYDAYVESLATTCCVESARTILINGIEMSAVKFMGVEVIPVPIWDDIIHTYEDTGAKYNNPHRAVFTAKSVLGIGVDNLQKMGDLNVWYDKKDKAVYIRGMGRADAKLVNPEYFTLAI